MNSLLQPVPSLTPGIDYPISDEAEETRKLGISKALAMRNEYTGMTLSELTTYLKNVWKKYAKN